MDRVRIFYFIILFVTITRSEDEKSSLVFVIDDTGSMGDDIDQVKKSTNLVFDTVMSSKSSQIENFVLVTFNDPTVRLRTVTKSREEFKRRLQEIYVYGGGDCPEMAMGGIKMGMENSLPGSNMYVFTDASAKDSHLLEKIQDMAITKRTQIVFLLTGRCSYSDADPQYQAYHTLAGATNGQVFEPRKTEISAIINYIADSIKSRKTVITTKTLPPGTNNVTIAVDPSMKDFTIAVSGKSPKVDVTDPHGSKPPVNTLFKSTSAVVVNVPSPVPGDYISTIGSTSGTSVVLTGTTTLQFKHGFSGIVPTSLKDTNPRPVPGDNAYLSIELETDNDNNVLDEVEIMDVKEKVIMKKPLKLLDKGQKLYITDSLDPPNKLFKIAIVGHNTKDGSKFRRMGPTAIEPQEPKFVPIANKSPSIVINGGPKFVVDYEESVKMSCKVNGYPKPDIVWMDKSGNIVSSKVSTVALPYDFINVLEIPKATESQTYTCVGENAIGKATQNAVLEVNKRKYFSVLEVPKDITIEYLKTGSITCKVDAYPPATISWFGNGRKLSTGSDFNISPDGSSLVVKNMKNNLIGSYYCEASNDGNRKTYNFNVNIRGFDTPVIDKTKTVERVEKGKDVQIACRAIKGSPKPKVSWFFKSQNSLTFTKTSDLGETLDLKRVGTAQSGVYKCTATNDAGEDTHETELIVGYVPLIDQEETNINARQGEKKTLKCVADGIPKPTVEWYFNRVKLVSNKDVHISSDNSLSFTGSADTEGQYMCRASNTYGTSSIIIQVQFIDTPVIDKTRNIERIERRRDAQIYCKVTKGTPKPEINWFFKPENSSYKELGNKNEVLLLRNVGLKHSGTYKCVATNIAGKDEHKTELIVGYAPTIVRDTSHVTSRAGTSTTLKCEADGIPKPKVDWFFNGVKIVSNRNHHIYRDNSLRFTGSLDNHGEYYCSASNTYGTAKKITRVNVVVPVAIERPAKSTLEVRIGEHLSLPCVADGFPRPKIEWVFTNSSRNIEKIITSDTSGSLNLGAVQLSHDGFYTCIASNGESSTNFTYQLNVLAPPHIEKRAKKNYKAIVGDYILTIPCKAIGIPKPDITWIKDGENVAAGSEWYDIGKDGTLVIKNADLKSAGTYVCHARNKVGSDSNNFKVHIGTYPDEKMITKIVYLERNSRAVLPCDIPRTKPYKLRWYKGGKVITNGEYGIKILPNEDHEISSVQDKHAGIYICHVSTYTKSSSAKIEVKIGSKPKFDEESADEEYIDYNERTYAYLDCNANGVPEPQVTWTHNGMKMGMKDKLNIIYMTPGTIGNYTCVVENQFGQINRNFEIVPYDCFLNIHEEFTRKQPMWLPYNRLPEYETSNGFLKIPHAKVVSFYCPSGFINFPGSTVEARCNEGNIDVGGNSFKFPEFDCKKEIKPVIQRTGDECKSRDTERIKIGYKKDREFLDVYEVCLDKNKNVPLYSKHKMHRNHAEVDLKNDTDWFEDETIKLKSNEVYFCEKQLTEISNVLRRPFHKDDKCCFKDRLLVSPRDLLGGLPQRAALTHLNVAPQWSTCRTENWDVLEKMVRNIAKKTLEGLIVWTGTADHLQLRDSSNNYPSINLRDNSGHSQAVPKYLWKVIQEPEIMKASVAVIQFNIPDLTMPEAKNFRPCKDICNEITWLRGTDWPNTSRGYTICCKLEDFKKSFGYSKEFGNHNDVLREISDFTSHSL